MPIYAYKCDSCGHQKDVLQKVSDPVLTQCPACGADAFRKQITAAGFQLKGSGWYVTDFRGGNGAAAKKEGGDGDAAAKEAAPAAAESKVDGAKAAAPAPAATSGPAPSPAPSPVAGSPSAGS